MPSALAGPQKIIVNMSDAVPQSMKIFLRRIGALCGMLIACIGTLTLLSWVQGMTIFSSLRTDYVPMEPSTATGFLLLGQVLILSSYVRMSRIGRHCAFFVTLVVLIASLIILGEFFAQQAFNVSWDIESLFSILTGSENLLRMSPLTAMNFVLASSAVLLLLLISERYHHRIGDLAFMASGLSLIILLGYLYGTPLFYSGRVPPMALTTAISFIILGVGLTAAVGPRHFPLSLLVGSSVRARMMRVFLPFTLVSIPVYSLVYRNVVMTAFANSLLLSTVVFAVLMGMTVSMMIHVIGGRIDQAAQERRRAEEARLRLASIVESSSDAILGIGTDKTVMNWNRGAQVIFGYTEDEIVGQPITKLSCPGKETEITALLLQALAGKAVESVETACVRKNGKTVDVMLSMSSTFDSQDNVVAASAIIRDVTVQKGNERTLHDSFARLTALIGHLPVAVLLEDEEGRVLHTNAKFCTLFNIAEEPASFIGRRSDELFDRCKSSMAHCEAYDRLRKEISEKKPILSEELLLNDGRVLAYDYMAVIADGAYRGSLWQIRDITERRRADQAKSNFILLASHQLRTPITAVRLTLETLGNEAVGPLNADQKGMVRQGMDYLLHMADTVRTLLSISRIEAGQVKPVMAQSPLRPLLEGILSEYRIESANRSQHLDLECPPDITLLTDANLLQEVLYSLVSNAINYTPDGGKVAIAVRRESDHVRIEVTDNGYGIPLKDQDKVFQKFFRAENAMDKRSNGTGIGLYLAQSLVTLLGGTITFQSQENKGTIFLITFPMTSHHV